MAYAALVSLAPTLLQILKHIQSSSFPLEKRQVRSLHKHVIFLQVFFEDFPEKANSLEGRIRNTANEAEDITERILSEQIRSFNYSSPHQAGGSMAHRHQPNFRRQCKKLSKVAEDIESIVKEVMEIKNSLGIQDRQLINDPSPTTSSSIQLTDSSSSSSTRVPTRKDTMVGFDADLMEIKSRLCGQSSKLEVIPIFGMGGIGKTTLARNAYNDELSIQCFDIRAWVTLSQDYSIQEILLSLVNSIKAFNELFDEEVHRYELMAEQVYKNLKGRKYLVVLDDMWSTKAWDDVKMLFPDDHNGSRIVLTTRILDVATYADSSSPPHEMHLMDVNQSWNLLRQKVFKQENCPPELEMIGMLVARRCRGLPLAIVVVAGLLSAAGQSRVAWERVAENVNLAVTSNSEQFAEILSLSYTHLPHHLRPCFLYMGRFREDREIHVSKLIKLWIAEGFLKASVSKSFEEAAEEYLEDLVKRCLVLVRKRKSNGKIKSCSVHDLVRDLCINKAQEEKFLLHVSKRGFDNFLPKFLQNQRRLIIHDFSLALYSNICSPAIRSLLLFADCQILRDSIKSFRFLRVLDAVGLRFKYFPEEVTELIHLRYLAFTNSEIGDFHLPASILHLWNLQTLFIYPYSKRYVSCGGGVSFPLEIWRMAQLRHLVIFTIDPLPNPSCSVPSASASALENLQTLATVTNFKCTKRVVGKIPNLKKLGIIYDGDRINWELYRLNNLVHLHQLEILKICVERGRRKPCPLWENLAFPVTLKKLTLRGCLLSRNDMATIGSLPNLEVLKLKDCFFKNCKWETAEGEFPHLHFLQIIHTNLQQWITESEHFPQLRWLTLCRCERLSEIPGVIGEIATLELIEVNHRDRSLVESAQQIKEEQESYGYDSLQVRIVSNSNYYYFY